MKFGLEVWTPHGGICMHIIIEKKIVNQNHCMVVERAKRAHSLVMTFEIFHNYNYYMAVGDLHWRWHNKYYFYTRSLFVGFIIV